MKSKAFNLLLALVSVLIWIAQTTDAQNITNFMVVHENKTHVLVSASVDPVSNTYTFDWLVSVNGGSDETLIQVGINGAPGMVMTNNRNPAFNFDIINIPSQLMPSNRPFVSELNYTFNCGERTLVFKVEASPLSISTNEIAAPRCPMTVDGRNVSCSDGSEDCFCPGSNIPGNISCPNGIIITVHCNDNCTFEPPGCQTTTTPTTTTQKSQTSVSSGGAMVVIGIFTWVLTFCLPLLYLTELTDATTTIYH